MNDYGREMIAKGIPKDVVESAFAFSNKALEGGLKSLVGKDQEEFKLIQKAMMTAYVEGARHMTDILKGTAF